MSRFREGAQLAVLAALMTGLSVQAEADSAPSYDVRRPNPDFPASELRRGLEGWVIVQYAIEADGRVGRALVKESSGSPAFEEAALGAIREWRFEPGAPRTTSVQIQFVYEHAQPTVSKAFFRKLRQVHEAIELGELDAASAMIRSIRQSGAVGAFENAYLLIAEGRIAEHVGDVEGQLGYFRKAALSQGRWLARSDYLKVLRGMTILELQLGDYEAAIVHYNALTTTRQGRKLAVDLDGAMRSVAARVAAGGGEMTDPATGDELVRVMRELRRARRQESPADDGFRQQPASSTEPLEPGGA